jgi:hypothetical protein
MEQLFLSMCTTLLTFGEIFLFFFYFKVQVTIESIKINIKYIKFY